MKMCRLASNLASPRFGYRASDLPPSILILTLLAEAAPPSRPSRALPSYLGISVRAEAPRAEPVPAWPYPNSWSGVIALQPVPVVYPRVRMLLSVATSVELFYQ